MAKERRGKKVLQAVKKFFQQKIVKKVLIIIGLVIVALAVIVLIFNLSYADKIFPKTYIGNTNFGGKTFEEARQILATKSNLALQGEYALQYQDKNWKIVPTDLDIQYNPEASAQKVWGVGRSGPFSKIIKEQVKAIFTRNSPSAVFSYNQSKLNDFLNNAAKEVDILEKDATVVIENLNPVIQPEKVGQKTNITRSASQILNAYGKILTSANLSLIVEEVKPKIGQNGALDAQEKAKIILSYTLTLEVNGKTYNLPPADFADWLEFVGVSSRDQVVGESQTIQKIKPGNFLSTWVLVVQIQPDKVKQYVGTIAKDMDQPAQDAKFVVKDGLVVASQISQVGYNLDQDKSAQMITEAILKSKPEIILPVKTTQPTFTSDAVDAGSFKEIVGEGKTSWRGSPPNRIHNLTLGSNNISGTIVKPGEEFSTVKAIGPIDAAAGFLPELVIKNSTQVTPEIGGGLCQVSTTLFRAVLNSGLKITDRTPHSFRVSYYEPPVGMDATIYDPAPDFKFVNNMNTPILIWAIPTDNGLNFQIYGTKDGRQVSISDPVVGNYVSPPAAVYTESSSMAPGEIRQVERATPGATASFNYKVTAADGKVLETETYVSKYVALPNSYLYGPGTVIAPPGE